VQNRAVEKNCVVKLKWSSKPEMKAEILMRENQWLPVAVKHQLRENGPFTLRFWKVNILKAFW